MRKTVSLALMLLFLLTGAAFGGDVLITAKIQDVAVRLDKHGKPYVLILINEERALKGISYEARVPVMAFGADVEKARTLKKGETLKAICDRREFKGRILYNILKIIP